jgi:hypothetical protein
MRAGKEGITFFYTLPPTWTKGAITLTAKLVPTVPPALNFGGGLPIRITDTNPANDAFTLTDMAFQSTNSVLIAPVAMRVPTEVYDASAKAFRHDPTLEIPDPEEVFGPGLNLLPVADVTGVDLGPYRGDVWITDIWYGPGDPTSKGALVRDRLLEHYDDFLKPGTAHFLIGVFPDSDANNVVRAVTGKGVAIVSAHDRPYSSVLHELGHMLGRPHAGGSCPDVATLDAKGNPVNGAFENWPGDDKGEILGVGVDTRTGRVLDPPGDGTGTQVYDFMSYCGKNSKGDSDKWQSVKGWQETFDALKRGQPGQLAIPAKGARPLQEGPTMIVRGIAFPDGSVQLTSVNPATLANIDPDPASPYTLVVKDADGNVLSETGMQVEEGHIDDTGKAFYLSAQVSSVNAQSVELVFGGATVASRTRSAHAPELQIQDVAPDVIRAGEVVSTVRWQAADADNDALMAKVDYSADGGQTWTPLYTGPNLNEATLDSRYLAASAQGLIRTRISDGFNETVQVSAPFKAAGYPPVVEILTPAKGRSLKKDATLYLSGRAYDDDNLMLEGDSLVWYVDEGEFARGATASLSGFDAGRHTVRFEATDALGRATSRSIEVNLLP